MNDWEGLFSQMQQQLDSKCNNRFSFTPKHMSTFLSLCLISLFACLLVSLAALLTTVSWCPFLSQWICLSEQSHSRRNRWVWNVPTLHTTMDDSSPQWGCVPECFSCLHMRLFSLSLSIHSIFFVFSLWQHLCRQNLTVSSVSPSLCLYFSSVRGHPVIQPLN